MPAPPDIRSASSPPSTVSLPMPAMRLSVPMPLSTSRCRHRRRSSRCRRSEEEPVAGAAGDRVGPGAGRDALDIGLHVSRTGTAIIAVAVVADAGADRDRDAGGACRVIDQIGAVAAGERVAAEAAVEGVGAVGPVERVVAAVAEQGAAPALPVRLSAPRPADEALDVGADRVAVAGAPSWSCRRHRCLCRPSTADADRARRVSDRIEADVADERVAAECHHRECRCRDPVEPSAELFPTRCRLPSPPTHFHRGTHQVGVAIRDAAIIGDAVECHGDRSRAVDSRPLSPVPVAAVDHVDAGRRHRGESSSPPPSTESTPASPRQPSSPALADSVSLPRRR